MKQENTIAAIATSYGQGSISIIRISGKDSLKYALGLINPSTKSKNNTNITDITDVTNATHTTNTTKTLKPKIATLCCLYNKNNELLDEAICIYFKAPYSYTGEDVVELQCHGGSMVSQIILASLYELGVEVAKNGEFSKRAFLNNKIDYAKASGISALIGAKSEKSAKLLSRITQGELSNLCDSIVKNLLKALSASEVSIDYSDEDLPLDLSKQINDIVNTILKKLKELKEKSIQKQGILKGFSIAIIGKPNVGKSSLLNKVLNDDRAIVTNIAGTTRDIIKEDFLLDGFMLSLIDTAGIRNASETIEKQGIQRSKKIAQLSDILIVLFDGNKNLSIEDELIVSLAKKSKAKKIYTINKTDLTQKFDEVLLKTKFDIKIEAKINAITNIDNLLGVLKKYLKTQDIDDIILISTMQIKSVDDCINSLEMAIGKIQANNEELELFSFYIYEAIAHLNNITKPVGNEDMLDMMFKDFCLGK